MLVSHEMLRPLRYFARRLVASPADAPSCSVKKYPQSGNVQGTMSNTAIRNANTLRPISSLQHLLPTPSPYKGDASVQPLLAKTGLSLPRIKVKNPRSVVSKLDSSYSVHCQSLVGRADKPNLRVEIRDCRQRAWDAQCIAR